MPPTEEEVPKLPRGKGITLSPGQMMRIGMTMVTLLAILVLQRPCSQAVGRFVTTFGSGVQGSTSEVPSGGPNGAPSGVSSGAPSGVSSDHGSSAASPSGAPGATSAAAPGGAPQIYERLSPSMTEEELRAAIERAKRRAAAAAPGAPIPGPGGSGPGSGSGSGSGPASGSAAPAPSAPGGAAAPPVEPPLKER